MSNLGSHIVECVTTGWSHVSDALGVPLRFIHSIKLGVLSHFHYWNTYLFPRYKVKRTNLWRHRESCTRESKWHYFVYQTQLGKENTRILRDTACHIENTGRQKNTFFKTRSNFLHILERNDIINTILHSDFL